MSYIKQASYLHLRGGIYQYIRRIPCDIRPHYKTDQLYFSLRTRSRNAANRISKSISQKLDDYWLGIRLQKMPFKGAEKSKIFKQAAIRNSGYVIDLLGDRNIADYSTADAGKFRNWLIGRKLRASSIRRVFGTIRSIINLSTSEYGLPLTHRFSLID